MISPFKILLTIPPPQNRSETSLPALLISMCNILRQKHLVVKKNQVSLKKNYEQELNWQETNKKPSLRTQKIKDENG